MDSSPNSHPFFLSTILGFPRKILCPSTFAAFISIEEVKLQLAEIEIAKPKNNLPYNELKAIKELKNNPEVNIKKADKGSTTVIMNKQNKIAEGQIQLTDEENYRPLATPMVKET